MKRRYQAYRKSPSTLFFEVISPVFLVAIGLAFRKVEWRMTSPPRNLEPQLFLQQNMFYNSQLLKAGDITPVQIMNNIPQKDSFIQLTEFENPRTSDFEQRA